MSIYRDKKRGCYVFEFDRVIEGRRVRARKLLPKTWSSTQADAYDRKESSRLYAIATRVEKPSYGIEDAVAIYIKERAGKLKSGENIVSELALMFWAYKGQPISALADVCKTYREQGSKADGSPLAPATLRNRIRYLTSACRYAWKHHAMHDRDPAERVVAPEVRNARQQYITRADMLRIAKACKCRQSRAAIRIAFYSGMRMSEIISASVQGDQFVLTDSKNGDPRIIPIHPRLQPALKVQLRDRYATSKEFKKAAKAVGLGDLRFHDLRHAAASEMINAGVDLYTVGAVLGHRSAASTKRYSHLATDSLRKALGKIGGRVKKSPTTKEKKVA